MSVYSYKCPNCSGSLIYNPNIEKLTCEYCKSKFTKNEIDEYLKSNPDKIFSQNEKSSINSEVSKETKIKGYNCSNCAAEVITDDTTLTTFCYYCHSPVVITDRVEGSFKPDKVIPFKYDKNEATNKFLNWVKKNRYVRKDFYSSSQLEKITGIYLPYWLIKARYNIDFQGIGYKTSRKIVGNSEIISTNEYQIVKSGNVEIENIAEIGYSKIDRKFLESISPYNFEEIEDFKVFYLNGFFSETFDLSKEEVESKVNNRITEYKRNLKNNIISSYDQISLSKDFESDVEKDWEYTLLPTWMMTYDYNNKKYIYAMNGQTGQIIGDLPIDTSKIIKDASIISIIVAILALLGGYFLW